MLRPITLVVLVSALLPAVASPQPKPDQAVLEALSNVYRLRNYTAFDWVSAAYNRGTLTLRGFVRTPQLKAQAADAARKARGVDEVVNELEVLPAHASDDEVRVSAYIAIYGSSALERYAPSGQLTNADILELRETSRFGLEGTNVGRGPHSIHLIVNGARVLLRGQVRTTGDRQIAEATVRTAPGVLRVVNELRVASQN